MKKIIGVLGVAVIAATMFFTANNVNSSGNDNRLVNLIAMNVAHADPENNNDLNFKEIDRSTTCAAQYDIQYEFKASGGYSAFTTSGGSISASNLTKLIGSLGLTYTGGLNANTQFSLYAKGKQQTKDITCKGSWTGDCVPKSCGQI